MYDDNIHSALHLQMEEAFNALSKDHESLVNIYARHSLHCNSKETVAIVFGPSNKRAVVVERFEMYIHSDQIKVNVKAKTLGLFSYQPLQFREHFYIHIKTMSPQKQCFLSSITVLLFTDSVMTLIQ